IHSRSSSELHFHAITCLLVVSIRRPSFPTRRSSYLPDRCLSYMVGLRWPDGVVCPTCGNRAVSFLSTRRLWKCREEHARRQFSKIGRHTFELQSPYDIVCSHLLDK